MSGQDTRRGTFTQRHSVIIDRRTGNEFTPLSLLAINEDGTPTGNKFMVYDSPLSGSPRSDSEYGYSVGNPRQWCCGGLCSATSSTAHSR